MQEQKTLIVIGGGAAGFFCAVNAARMNTALKVVIVEKSNKLLSKVKVSGGGRCNVTHACFDIDELSKKYPRGERFVRKAFHWFNTNDTINWFEERGVKLKKEEDGRMFPVTNSSQTVMDCLLREANKYNIEILMNCEVKEIKSQDNSFQLITNQTKQITTDFLCIACGGFPKSNQFSWLTSLVHSIAEPQPSLFTFNIPQHAITQLMGVSVVNATVKIIGTKLQEQGALLITHWGLSGPVVLKLSAWGARILADKNYHFTIHVNWLDNYNEQSLRDEWNILRQQLSSNKIIHKNPFQLANRLWQFLLHQSFINEETRWSDITSKQQNLLIKNLIAQEFEVKGKTTFKEEFVTSGGIQLNEIDVNTMQSKIMSHLFFAGEIMDVDGITGGFNFQHAWTSGFIAAKTIAELSK